MEKRECLKPLKKVDRLVEPLQKINNLEEAVSLVVPKILSDRS